MFSFFFFGNVVSLVNIYSSPYREIEYDGRFTDLKLLYANITPLHQLLPYALKTFARATTAGICCSNFRQLLFTYVNNTYLVCNTPTELMSSVFRFSNNATAERAKFLFVLSLPYNIQRILHERGVFDCNPDLQQTLFMLLSDQHSPPQLHLSLSSCEQLFKVLVAVLHLVETTPANLSLATPSLARNIVKLYSAKFRSSKYYNKVRGFCLCCTFLFNNQLACLQFWEMAIQSAAVLDIIQHNNLPLPEGLIGLEDDFTVAPQSLLCITHTS